MTETYLTPSREANALRRLRPRYAEAQWRLRKLGAALDTLEPSRSDYTGEAEGRFERDRELWQDQQNALEDLQAFLGAGLAYLEGHATAEDMKALREGKEPGVETEDPELIERLEKRRSE